jgi:HAD superfamily hydrolase (TIGR01456 family)
MDRRTVSELDFERLGLAFSKLRKQSINLLRQKKQPTFGICFDCDGVLARGTLPIKAAQRAFKRLVDDNGQFIVPIAFVTNSLNKNADKAKVIGEWFDVEVSQDQMVQAQGPLEMFSEYHNKHCLLIGQGKIKEIAKELGFKKTCTIEDVVAAYPLLDMVDHDNRRKVAQEEIIPKSLPRIEAVILLGEPKRWESSLQLIIDLLRTDGKPDHMPNYTPEKHLPVIACNMDLEFMHRAVIPRYGHGAYLVCLEALYKKVTGKDLKYTALVGKPSEITYRYAEHVLAKQAKKLGFDAPLKHMYLVGDCLDSDIVGCNLYQRYLDRKQRRNSNIESEWEESSSKDEFDSALPESRNIPEGTKITKQTVESCMGILVCTGVYKPETCPEPGTDDGEEKYPGHRDFSKNMELYKPEVILSDCEAAIEFIFEREGMAS